MNNTTQPPAPLNNVRGAFWIGGVAVLALYSVFGMRHFSAVASFLDQYSAGLVALMGVFLFVLAAISGAYTTWTKPTTKVGAFSVGLSVPGLLMAADLAGPPIGDTEAESASVSRAGGVLGASDEGGLFDALRIVFSPISVVREEQAQQVVAVREQNDELASKNTELAAERQTALQQKAQLSSQFESLQQEKEDTELRLQASAQQRLALSARLQETTRSESRLRAELQQASRQLTAARTARAIDQRAVSRLTSELQTQKDWQKETLDGFESFIKDQTKPVVQRRAAGYALSFLGNPGANLTTKLKRNDAIKRVLDHPDLRPPTDGTHRR